MLRRGNSNQFCQKKILKLKKSNDSFYFLIFANYVATLALGSRPRQGLARLQAKREIGESHLVL